MLGAGGHAVVCIDSLLGAGYDVVGAIGDARPDRPIQVPVLGADDQLPRLLARGVTSAFVAIGDNRVRERLMADARREGLTLVNAISPGARVAATADLGENVAIMAGAVVNAYTRIGDGVIINTGAGVDHDGDLGPMAHVGPGCQLAGKVTVAGGAFLGVGSSVIPGCRIGCWSQLAAGSVVITDIGDGMLAMGVPAREVRSLHE